MNKTIIRPEWIPSAYTEDSRKEYFNPHTSTPKVRLLKHSTKIAGRRTK